MTRSYDVLILGGGNAGMAVTVPTRKAGLSVALVEQDLVGGTCPNRGCTPKKVLVAAAQALHDIERAKDHCISVGEPRLDWAGLIDREKNMISHLPESFTRTLRERQVEVLRGHAAFAGLTAVRVGEDTVEAKHIVIATGSTPRKLPIEGAEHMITSDDVLSERELPREVVFIGGGVIALEFSHVYARAGTKVTILEVLPHLLGQMDADAVGKVREESERIGITLRMGVKVQRIVKMGDRIRVEFEDAGSARMLEADRVVNGAGRVPNVEMLDLDAGKIAHDKGRIAIDDHLCSMSNEAVWVAGDPLASPQLSPIATYEGRIVGRNIVEGRRHKPDYSSIPSCVYTVPTLAAVGLSEAAANEQGLNVRIVTNDMLDWLSARTYAETVSWSKVLIDETTDKIVGAHMVGHASEELINTFAFAMRHGISASQIREMVYAFPTFAADLPSMV
jgi:glutathione reductase (NADPH)